MENNHSTRLLPLLLLFLFLTITTASITTDLNSTASVAGVKAILDYSSLSGDRLLPSPSPSPQFMPAGDTSNGNCIGLMVDFYALFVFFIVKDMVFGTVDSSVSWDEYCNIFSWCSAKALLCIFAFNVLRQIFSKFR